MQLIGARSKSNGQAHKSKPSKILKTVEDVVQIHIYCMSNITQNALHGGKNCNNCGGRNHFGCVCENKNSNPNRAPLTAAHLEMEKQPCENLDASVLSFSLL